ncbi:MAG: alginate lyase family protein [Solirubrobacterales bacterium]
MVLDGTLEELEGLGSTGTRGLALPEAHVVGPARRRRPTRKAMLGNLFYVYGSEAELAPPIDWLQDPQGSRSWRYELHTLTWLKEALARHAEGGDVEMLALARDVAVDWARAHRQETAGQSEFAWYDMAVGLRAPYLAYVLRACLAEQILDDESAALLLEAAERHGAELADGRNYAAGNNHGLFQDEGLYLLARLLPVLPSAAAWRELALNRMRATLAETISFEDGAHLEHSPAYQLAMVDLVARLAPNVGELPELGPLLDRMRRTAAWQTTPLGRMAQLGDTDDLPAPRWARQAANGLRGINVLPEAGQAFVREGGSYLAVAAAHHGRAHKHADDGGFVLVEDGRVVLGDAGRWGYYEDEPDRLYARSAAAHNVLTVDEGDFEWRGGDPYGSGFEAAGEADGWYAIVVRNPLLEGQGARHRRGLFYRPGRALVVIDQVRSEQQRAYERHFHFGPELELSLEGDGRIAFSGEGMAGALIELTGGSEANVTRGQEDPRCGWTYPSDRQRTEVSTVRLRSLGKDATLLTAVSMDGEPVEEIPAALGRLL